MIFLGCSADGSYEVKLLTKAVVYYTGDIFWQPPAIYKGRIYLTFAASNAIWPQQITSCQISNFWGRVSSVNLVQNSEMSFFYSTSVSVNPSLEVVLCHWCRVLPLRHPKFSSKARELDLWWSPGDFWLPYHTLCLSLTSSSSADPNDTPSTC